MADNPNSEVAELVVLLSKLRGRHGLAPVGGPDAKLKRLGKFLQVRAVDPAELDDPGRVARIFTDSVRNLSIDLTPYSTASTPLIIADTIFALGLLAGTYSDDDADPVVRNLFSGSLGERRETLIDHWEELHLAVDGRRPAEKPTEGTLRKSLETRVLADLASLLSIVVERKAVGTIRGHSAHHPPRIAVVGGATTDLTLSVESVPAQETSSEVTAQRHSPGGKGLLQAVAAARLGASSTLIAAVADDQLGQQITDVLAKERVDISQLKRVQGANSPITYVIEESGGASIAVNVRGDVVLDPADIRGVAELLGSQDGVLVTFEIPPATLKCLLGLTQLRQLHRPVVVVTPGQPYLSKAGFDRLSLKGVDCLVARSWELARLFPNERDLSDEQLVDYFLQAGVGVVCLMDRQGCTVHCAEDRSVFRAIISPRIPRNSSVARDAFCAALITARCCTNSGASWQEAVQWATAAMARAAQEFADLIDANLDAPDDPPSNKPDGGRILSIESLPDRDLVDSRSPAVEIDQIRLGVQPLASVVTS